jgi:hypothetical protein
LQLRAFGTLCGAAGDTVGGSAATGIVLQSAPHPLGVPAIGENEYVWSSDSPAVLRILARALGYTWGWEPDLGWLADKTVFRVEPGIPTEDTKPGYKTVAQGRELVAQSLDGQTDSLMDGLVYRSRYLPPKNTDFGKKKVYFEVEGNKVDYADYEIIAYLIEYEKLKQAKDLWQHDWAQYGLQYGRPPSPFPYYFERNGVRYPSSQYENDLITDVPCLR